MAFALISSTKRMDVSAPRPEEIGPGSYVIPSSIKVERPSFVAFTSSSSNLNSFFIVVYNMFVLLICNYLERAPFGYKSDPSPGGYNVRENLLVSYFFILTIRFIFN